MYAAHITLNINALHLPPLLRVYKVYALFLVVMFHFHNFANVNRTINYENIYYSNHAYDIDDVICKWRTGFCWRQIRT